LQVFEDLLRNLKSSYVGRYSLLFYENLVAKHPSPPHPL